VPFTVHRDADFVLFRRRGPEAIQANQVTGDRARADVAAPFLVQEYRVPQRIQLVDVVAQHDAREDGALLQEGELQRAVGHRVA
jgi:hypothetical protein